MAKIPLCTNCGNDRKGHNAKRCAKCLKVTCQRCSFSGCTCGSKSYKKQYKIGQK